MTLDKHATVLKVQALARQVLHHIDDNIHHRLPEDVKALVLALGDPEPIARVCHEANRSLCAAFGDFTQLPWDQAPQWQRDSAIKGVEFIRANPGAPPSANHESWSAQKVADCWVYGEVKNPEATPPTHPCLVPFDQLPPEQQAKDFVFGAIARAMLS